MRRIRAAKEDFNEFALPSSRRAQFADCYKERFWLMAKIAFFTTLFALPVIIVMLFRDYQVSRALSGISPEDLEARAAVIAQGKMIFGPILILAYSLFFFLFAGLVQVMKQLIWGEPIFFWNDFKDGMKSFGFAFAGIAFALSLGDFTINMLTSSLANDILTGVLLLLLFPIGLWSGAQAVFYKTTIAGRFVNALKFTIRTFPLTMLLTIALVGPFYLVSKFIPQFLVAYLVILLITFFLVTPVFLGFLLCAAHYFDRFVNKEMYPLYYRKGLSPEKPQD